MTDNQICFECKLPITDDKWSGLRVRQTFYSFHRACARRIIEAHIINTLDREEHIQRMYAERKQAELLADRLGFCARFDIQHKYHDPDSTGVCSVCGQPFDTYIHRFKFEDNQTDPLKCNKCGFQLGYHSSDSLTCPER